VKPSLSLELADDLDALEAGLLDAAALAKKYAPQAGSFPLNIVWPEVQRLLDAAGRPGDAHGYDAGHDAAVRELVTLLRHGAGATELSRFTFAPRGRR